MRLLEELLSFQRMVDYFIQFDHLHSAHNASESKKFNFEEVCRIGSYSVGVCQWSAFVKHDPEASVVYLAMPAEIHGYGLLITPLVFKEFWQVEDNPPLIEVRIGLPKERWWHFRRYESKWEPRRTPDTYPLEEAVNLARAKAEKFNGLTVDQQNRITELVKEMKLRDHAMIELEMVLRT